MTCAAAAISSCSTAGRRDPTASRVLRTGYPFAVLGAIVLPGIDSVDGQSLLVPMRDSPVPEALKSAPLLADTDALGAVVSVGFAGRAIAAVMHRGPHAVERRRLIARTCSMSREKFRLPLRLTSRAFPTFASPKMIRAHRYGLAALADAWPKAAPTLADPHRTNNGQLAELLTCRIIDRVPTRHSPATLQAWSWWAAATASDSTWSKALRSPVRQSRQCR
jgi:hypothetical protein